MSAIDAVDGSSSVLGNGISGMGPNRFRDQLPVVLPMSVIGRSHMGNPGQGSSNPL